MQPANAPENKMWVQAVKELEILLIVNSPQLRDAHLTCDLLKFLAERSILGLAPPNSGEIAMELYGDNGDKDKDKARKTAESLREKLEQCNPNLFEVKIPLGEYKVEFRELERPILPLQEALDSIWKGRATEEQGKRENLEKVAQNAAAEMSTVKADAERLKTTLAEQEAESRAEAEEYSRKLLSAEKSCSTWQHRATNAEREKAELQAKALHRSALQKWGWIGSAAITVALAIVLLVSQFQNKPHDPVSMFWRGILDPNALPLVVFANAEFKGNPKTKAHLRQEKDAPPFFSDYAGVGSVLGAHALDGVFSNLHREFELKRSLTANLADARVNTKTRDLILIGAGPANHLSVDRLLAPLLQHEFTFQLNDIGQSCIMDLNPDHYSGKPADKKETNLYCEKREIRSDNWGPPQSDYALIVFARDTGNSRSSLLLAGDTAVGSGGAVDFLCFEKNIKKLESWLRNRVPASSVPQLQKHGFSALLSVTISTDGSANDPNIVDLRPSSD